MLRLNRPGGLSRTTSSKDFPGCSKATGHHFFLTRVASPQRLSSKAFQPAIQDGAQSTKTVCATRRDAKGVLYVTGYFVCLHSIIFSQQKLCTFPPQSQASASIRRAASQTAVHTLQGLVRNESTILVLLSTRAAFPNQRSFDRPLDELEHNRRSSASLQAVLHVPLWTCFLTFRHPRGTPVVYVRSSQVEADAATALSEAPLCVYQTPSGLINLV